MWQVWRVRASISLALALVFSLAGCVNDTIKLDSKDTIVPAARVAWQAVESGERSGIGLGFSGLVVEGELSYSAANDNQSVAVGHEVTLDNTLISGPTRLRNRAKLIDAVASLRGGLAIGPLVRIEPMMGVEVATVDLQIESSGIQTTDVNTSGGLMTGLRLGIQAHEYVELYGQASYGILGATQNANTALWTRKVEGGVRVLPIKFLGLFAAYRHAQYDQVRDSDESDAVLTFAGPILGLDLHF